MTKPKPIAAFNSPFELGVRMVYLLNSLQPAGADLQKLVLLDYAVVYSDDLGGLPAFTRRCRTVAANTSAAAISLPKACTS